MSEKKNGCNCGSAKRKIPYRWCAEELECIGIQKGDSLDTVIRKINEKYCDLNPDGRPYTFHDNEECDNGGFLVMHGDEIVYETCYDCCGTGKVVFNRGEKSTLTFEETPTVLNPGGAYYHASNFSYTIQPSDGTGKYEFMLKSARTIGMTNGELRVGVCINNAMDDIAYQNHYVDRNLSISDGISVDAVIFRPDLNLQVGDVISIACSDYVQPFRDHTFIKITKLD